MALRGGVYRDSFSDTAVYGGLSYRKEWFFTEHTFAGLGLQAGYLDGSGVNGFAALPMTTLGYKSVVLEIGNASKLDFVPGQNMLLLPRFRYVGVFDY